MYASLNNLLLSPRVWLCAGLFSLGVAIVIGYHQDQLAAQHALAQKMALPDQLIIQDFLISGELSRLSDVTGPDHADYSEMRRILFGMAAVMILLGLALLFSLLPSRNKQNKADASYEVKAVGTFPAVDPFPPIAGQDEKANGDGPVQRVSRILSSTALMFRAKSRP